ncbi:hypothetical protein AYI73_01035 [Shewanella algae]|uniref:hypothetical protein n=1 Tax=Shewanella sp. K8 TaxID=2992763 RepID=UPI001BEF3F0D
MIEVYIYVLAASHRIACAKRTVLGRPVLHGVPIRAAGDGELAAKRKFIGEFRLKAMIAAVPAA